MFYYDPTNHVTKELSEISKLYNASFPEGIEVIDNGAYFLLHYQDQPTPTVEQEVRNTGIQLIEGKYWQTYTLVDLPKATVCERLEASFSDKVSDRLNEFAAEKGYESIATACSYATSTVARYKAEGEKAIAARDQTWTKFYEVLDEALDSYKAGGRSVPTWDEIEEQLPTLSWE